jgi:hypothetical protein
LFLTGRYGVKRGERSHIRVWAPCPPSKKKLHAWRAAGAIAEDRPRTFFRLEAVLSATQVEALPPPAEPAPLDPPFAEVQGDSLAWATIPLQQLAGELGYDVVCEPLERGHGGSCDPTAKRVTINCEQAVNAQVDVLCHELAHVLVRVDRHDDDPTLGYAEEELVAESVVFWRGRPRIAARAGASMRNTCHRRAASTATLRGWASEPLRGISDRTSRFAPTMSARAPHRSTADHDAREDGLCVLGSSSVAPHRRPRVRSSQ